MPPPLVPLYPANVFRGHQLKPHEHHCPRLARQHPPLRQARGRLPQSARPHVRAAALIFPGHGATVNPSQEVVVAHRHQCNHFDPCCLLTKVRTWPVNDLSAPVAWWQTTYPVRAMHHRRSLTIQPFLSLLILLALLFLSLCHRWFRRVQVLQCTIYIASHLELTPTWRTLGFRMPIPYSFRPLALVYRG